MVALLGLSVTVAFIVKGPKLFTLLITKGAVKEIFGGTSSLLEAIK